MSAELKNGSQVQDRLLNPGDFTNLTNLTGANASVATTNPAGIVSASELVVHRVLFTHAEGTVNRDIVLTNQERVLDVVVVKTEGAGGAGDTVQVQNAANNITDAMVTNVADTLIVRPLTIDDAFFQVAAAGTLRIRKVNGGAANSGCEVFVICVRT